MRMKRMKNGFQKLVNSLPVQAVLYAGMLLLILLFFTGNGEFIYEAF